MYVVKEMKTVPKSMIPMCGRPQNVYLLTYLLTHPMVQDII
jgi:hypothetical protein